MLVGAWVGVRVEVLVALFAGAAVAEGPPGVWVGTSVGVLVFVPVAVALKEAVASVVDVAVGTGVAHGET